ncbi:MAG TPA: NUDIX domain-containing protein [Candidatus Bathyarchaeia archaeon]|nr:NUDIX domain-containing protein [Candidatus Bathyarchaeia archaeon]
MDSKFEILDSVDRQGNVIGQATRKEFHHNPKLIHQVAHCWIFNKKGQILWQQRSLKKDLSPGYWDMSCGDHVPTGETPERTLKRELEEELGLTDVNFKLVDKYIQGNEQQTELIYLYYAIVDKPAEEFSLQEEEVEKVIWIDVQEAQMKYVKNELESTEWVVSQVSRILQKVFSERKSEG